MLKVVAHVLRVHQSIGEGRCVTRFSLLAERLWARKRIPGLLLRKISYAISKVGDSRLKNSVREMKLFYSRNLCE